jgi:1-acyl-sn-glycerol-3-phosphate acyltransferase
MLKRIISVVYLAFIAASSIAFFVGALILRALTSLWDRRLALLHLYTSFWASLYVWLMPAWKVVYRGRGKIRKRAAYVVVSNHQSQVDILAAFGLFFHFKWVSKAEMFKVPLIGWNMALNRYIKLKRGDRLSVRRMMADCRRALAAGSSVFLFPEGTRSRNGRLKEFKPGAFILAHEMKAPILPIAISGSRRALPKHSMVIQGFHRIRIKVLDEIPYQAFAGLNVEETAAMVRRTIAAHVEDHREMKTAPQGA